MTPEDQDKIDSAVDFVVKTQNGIIAEVNQQNTVIKSDSRENIVIFLSIDLNKYVRFDPKSILEKTDFEYPLLKLVMAGLGLQDPDRIYYKHQRVLIAVHGDIVLGIAPATTEFLN